MATKEELEAQVSRLQTDNERLRGQLAAAGNRPAANVPAALPFLTEGQRQELLTFGQTTRAGGGAALSLSEARELFPDVDLSDATDAALAADERLRTEVLERASIRGVTHVWPSIEPGVLDPAAVGLPGISGPGPDAQA
jgi:uncharacterized protein YciI